MRCLYTGTRVSVHSSSCCILMHKTLCFVPVTKPLSFALSFALRLFRPSVSFRHVSVSIPFSFCFSACIRGLNSPPVKSVARNYSVTHKRLPENKCRVLQENPTPPLKIDTPTAGNSETYTLYLHGRQREISILCFSHTVSLSFTHGLRHSRLLSCGCVSCAARLPRGKQCFANRFASCQSRLLSLVCS